MAQKVAAATGNWSTAATWNSVTNTPTLHASTNITISTSNLFTATFTAPNLVNACTGVLLYLPAVGSGGTVTVTLQESTVDTAAARSIAVTSLVAATWVYFRFATPYVFTTIAAGAYRFKIVNAGAAGTTTAAADSGAANIAYLATDDRTGVPGTTDDVWICGQNQATAITVTMDGTQTIGSKTDTALAVQRTLGNAISINNLGVLAWDTATDATLTCGGNIICNNGGGDLQMGTVATPMPSARIAKLRFDMATSGNHGLRVFPTGKLTLQGTPKSSTSLWKAKLVSGVGTAASPLVVDAAVDWSVGDEIAISATSANATNYNETEYRYIITKNSATSYVLSTTSGGVEAAFSFTHSTDAWVINIQRNVLIDSTDTTKAFYIFVGSSADGNVDVDWARFETIGVNATSKNGFTISTFSGTIGFGDVDYSVFYRYYTGLLLTATRSILSFTGIVSVNQASGGANGGIQTETNAHRKTFTDCFTLGAQQRGFSFTSTFDIQMTRCYAIACNIANGALSAGITVGTSGSIVANDCETHACRRFGVLVAGASDVTFNALLCGTKGINTSVDVSSTSDVYNKVLFINSSFGSATLMSNYLAMLAGSEVSFHAYNGNSNNHIWYTNTGEARSTGAGLTDTTTRTVGSLALRIASEDSTTGFFWESLIGISANSAASIFGFIQKNAAFGTDVCTVELFLPGSTVADASQTMGNTTGTWLVFTLAASYTGSVAAFARVRITARTTTASAYCYVADLYNGTNVLTSFKAWNEGKPSPVFTDLLGDPASVWAILESTQTTVGTMGYEILNDLLTLRTDVDDLQTRIPATLDGGNMRSSVKAMDNDIITAAVLAASAITEIQSGLAVPGSAMTLTAGERDAIAAAFLDLADAIETGLTPRQAMRLFASALAGVLSGAATNTVTIRNAVANSKARITATVDSDGNRTAVVTDTT